MSIDKAQELLLEAQRRGFSLCGFNIHNLETLKAVILAAAEKEAPVILQATPGTVRFAGAEFLAAMAGAARRKYRIPVILHLDHGDSYEVVEECLAAGFDSVMIDGSKLPYRKNVELVGKVVARAHAAGANAEAELGTIGGVEDDLSVAEAEMALTDPDAAADFVRETGVDSLAVAIGTRHGLYKKPPNLDFERLRDIRARVDVPLVLHGASDLPDESVQRCINLGICKVNIATELKVAFARELRKVLTENPQENDPRRLFKPGILAVQAVAGHKLELTGSAGKGRS